MSTILFVVHGMGVHGGDWQAPVVAKLNEVASRYEHFAARAFDEQVQVVPVTYDPEFAKHLAQWSGSAEALDTFAKDNAVSIPAVIAWLRGASETEKNFFWSHVVDVLLYRYFQLVTVPVRLQVMTQIVTTVTAAMKDGGVPDVSVMGHSLGTSVTHDALAYLGTTAFNGSEAFMAGNFRFSNVFMVANVGRILETTQKCYASCVHPLSTNPQTAYCSRYFNFRHQLDPFPAVRAFKPVGWGADFHAREDLNHLHDFNVHGFEHYLDHPAVHIPVINALLGPVIGAAEAQNALAAYPRTPPNHPCLDKLSAAEQRFRQLVALIETSDDPVQLIIAGAQFLATAKEAKDACV